MCRFCEQLNGSITDMEYGYGVEADNNRSTFCHVCKSPDVTQHYLEVNDTLFSIKFCPWCGRQLNN